MAQHLVSQLRPGETRKQEDYLASFSTPYPLHNRSHSPHKIKCFLLVAWCRASFFFFLHLFILVRTQHPFMATILSCISKNKRQPFPYPGDSLFIYQLPGEYQKKTRPGSLNVLLCRKGFELHQTRANMNIHPKVCRIL